MEPVNAWLQCGKSSPRTAYHSSGDMRNKLLLQVNCWHPKAAETNAVYTLVETEQQVTIHSQWKLLNMNRLTRHQKYYKITKKSI